ncbi:helix-turn-helix domain-containing protein [Streptomyces sp. NPDC005122]
MRDLPDDNNWIPEVRRAVGNRLRAERERQNLTQEQVMLAALDRVTLWRVETGEESKLGTLLRIAWVLDIPLADLVR